MDASALNTRGVTSMYMHQPTAALEDFKQASRVLETMPWPHFNCGLIYLAKNQLTQALEAFSEAHRLDRKAVVERLSQTEHEMSTIEAHLDPFISVNLAVVKVRRPCQRSVHATSSCTLCAHRQGCLSPTRPCNCSALLNTVYSSRQKIGATLFGGIKRCC
jgi:tetratricopeptide (TPR) repeat protein